MLVGHSRSGPAPWGSAGTGRCIERGIPVVRRNSPTVLNTGFNGLDRRRRRRRGSDDRRAFDGTVASVDQAGAPMFWDNRVRSLEAQALEPLQAMEEMRGTAYSEDAAVDPCPRVSCRHCCVACHRPPTPARCRRQGAGDEASQAGVSYRPVGRLCGGTSAAPEGPPMFPALLSRTAGAPRRYSRARALSNGRSARFSCSRSSRRPLTVRAGVELYQF